MNKAVKDQKQPRLYLVKHCSLRFMIELICEVKLLLQLRLHFKMMQVNFVNFRCKNISNNNFLEFARFILKIHY